jgi:uncharacterized membrane protein YvbJ
MKFCKKCGNLLKPNDIFCTMCGEKIAKEKALYFCKDCGKKVNDLESHECMPNYDHSVKQPEETYKIEIKHSCNDITTPESMEPCTDLLTKFCKRCGKKNDGGESYCTECMNSSIKSNPTAKCNICGESLDSNHNCPNCSKAEKAAKKNGYVQKSNSHKKWIVSLAILFAILIGCGTGSYFYIQKESKPTKTVDEFISALQTKDVDTLIEKVKNSNTQTPLNKTEMKQLLNQIHSSPIVLRKIKSNMKDQSANIMGEKDQNIQPYVFELIKLKEQKFIFIDQYEIVLNPISFKIKVDQDANVFVNENDLKQNSSEERSVLNSIPGIYHLIATKSSDFGNFNTEQTVNIWENPKESINLTFNEQYITIENNYSEVEIYLDGNKFLTTKNPTIKIGPLPPNKQVKIQGKRTYPWGDGLTTEYIAKANDHIKLEFPAINSDVENVIYTSIFDYNQSYITAITYLDSSGLINVKNPKKAEVEKFINDLMQRNENYCGRIDNMIFDKQSLKMNEENGEFIASVNVEENYYSGWKAFDSFDQPELIPKKYYYTYMLSYDSSAQQWIVYKNVKKKNLSINTPYTLAP